MSTARKVALGRTSTPDARFGDFEFISSKTKRIKGGGRTPNHSDVVEWIVEICNVHIDAGNMLVAINAPITMIQLILICFMAMNHQVTLFQYLD